MMVKSVRPLYENRVDRVSQSSVCLLECFDSVEVGLHTVVLNKVISYLILYNKSTFPGYFTCGLVYNGHLAGTG
jgi:hypothetical protein